MTHIVLLIIAMFIGVYSLITFFQAIWVLYQVKRGILDELEKKIVFDSLAYTMFIILLLHTVQFIFGLVAFTLFKGTFTYIPIISSGAPFGKIVLSNLPNWHFEALFADCFIFAIIYFFRKQKYRA
ncbi:hypothetical protein [Candidatus Enterococcus mansonii]|uniref:Uncharacterized protein n=1 Tax=Candidatus Enterococcus mansonii TaxID=1834181 RepID=A0A242CHU6_9ENTE|nr:hypothetical protein [Enterococcus sp. 4G2_DIV0659]OTO09807.1 hypothetical protein A5880_000490 [Enterococcus sp. 4G2_DIV0659]